MLLDGKLFDERIGSILECKETINRSQPIFMALYSKESLESLRQRVDLCEVVSTYVPMQRSGASYKGLCPFHEERTPSFIIHKGDSHYHCFGCGAHGDAISFLMNHAKMTFIEALEYLAEKFQVPLEKVEEEEKGPNKKRLKQALEKSLEFYRFFLLHSEEGAAALEYLYERDIDLPFIQRFEIGYAPKQGDMVHKLLKTEGFSEEELQQTGLLRPSSRKDFFQERIMFPIRDRTGAVIGFSARKFKEETFGGKYINTPETPLFKKSHVLFGFSYSRHRMAKERKALIVEGQIDALRLIFSGFDFTVAGQGTAFGEGHLKELLSLGVNHVYLGFDADKAGLEAAVKVGDLFLAKGVEVTFLQLPSGEDPDSFLRQKGKEAFSKLLENGIDYLSFYYRYLSEGQDLKSPSKKNEVVETIAKKIRQWEHPVLVHESLRRLSEMAGLPEGVLGVKLSIPMRPAFSKTPSIDPDRVLEMDLLRWLFLIQDPASRPFLLIEKNLGKKDFKIAACAHLFEVYFRLSPLERKDWIGLASCLQKQEEQQLLSELLQKKVNIQRLEECVFATVQKILSRNWMEKRGEIQAKIKAQEEIGEDASDLLLQLAHLSRHPPQVADVSG